jgi:hypothetical protein
MSKRKDICCYKVNSGNRVAYVIFTDKKTIEEAAEDKSLVIVSISEVLEVLK